MYYWIIILTSGKVITSPNFNWILYNNSLQIQDQITSILSFLEQVGKVSPIFIPHKTLVAATPYQFSGSGFFFLRHVLHQSQWLRFWWKLPASWATTFPRRWSPHPAVRPQPLTPEYDRHRPWLRSNTMCHCFTRAKTCLLSHSI